MCVAVNTRLNWLADHWNLSVRSLLHGDLMVLNSFGFQADAKFAGEIGCVC